MTLSHPTASASPTLRPVRDLAPIVHVGELRRSVGFYEKLGFVVTETNRDDGDVRWVGMESGGGRIVLTPGMSLPEQSLEEALFCIYTDDLAALRERLISQGIWAGDLVKSTINAGREMRITDPDGHCLVAVEIDR